MIPKSLKGKQLVGKMLTEVAMGITDRFRQIRATREALDFIWTYMLRVSWNFWLLR